MKNSDIEIKTQISNIGAVDSTLFGKDKIHNINNLVTKINGDYEIIKQNFKDELTIEYLKKQCLLIEEFILDVITYAKTTPLEEKRLRVLIWNVKSANSIQKKFEKKLIQLKDKRDIDIESAVFAAFDFELDDDNEYKEIKYLPNALEIEERILNETGWEKEKRTKNQKAGRKKAEIKDAKEYLDKFFTEGQKLKFIAKLRECYKDSEHKVFNLVVRALLKKGLLKEFKNKPIKVSFEKALGRKPQSQSNFDKQLSQNLDETEEYKNISKKIQSIFDKSLTS